MVVEVLALWSMNGFPASCGDNVHLELDLTRSPVK